MCELRVHGLVGVMCIYFTSSANYNFHLVFLLFICQYVGMYLSITCVELSLYFKIELSQHCFSGFTQIQNRKMQPRLEQIPTSH